MLGKSTVLNPPGTGEWVEACREAADEEQSREWAKRFGYVLMLGIAAEAATIAPLAYLVMTMPVRPALALACLLLALASLLCAEKVVKAAGNWCVAASVGIAFRGKQGACAGSDRDGKEGAGDGDRG